MQARSHAVFFLNQLPALVGLVLASLFANQMVAGQDVEPLLVVFVGVSVVLLLMAVGASTKRESRLMNGSAFVLGVYVMRFTGGAIVTWLWPHYEWQSRLWRTYYDVQLQASVFNPALLMALLGLLGLYSGLSVMPPKPLLKSMGNSVFEFGRNLQHRTLVLACVALTCGILSMFAPVQVRYIFTALGSTGAPLAIFASYWAFRSTTGNDRNAWFGILMLVLMPLVISTIQSGMREGVLKVPVYVGCGYILARRRVPSVAIAGAVLLGVFIVLPVLNAYKAAAAKQERRVDNVVAVMESGDYRSRLEDTVGVLLIRLNGTSFLSAYGRYYDSVYPFAHGDTFLLTLQGLVPRLIWPSKPEISSELNMYPKSVGIVGWTDDETTATFDSVSEYYLNFGYVGVVVLSYLHGIYLSCVRRIAVRWCHPLLGGMSFIALVIVDHDQFGFFQLFVSHSRMLIVWIILFRMLLIQDRRLSWRATSIGAASGGYSS